MCHDRTMFPSVTLTSLGGTQPDAAVVSEVAALLAHLVASGAALGWVEPPSRSEVEALLRDLTDEAENADASIMVGRSRQQLIAFGCWRRYQRPTHRPHADIPYLAVESDFQGKGLGGRMLDQLIETARTTGIEQLTLDARGDNRAAHALWRSRGFVEYGRIADFVAVGGTRYVKTFWVLDLRAG
jgi:ribosomal protein S18 acetylase RimI-like enzyme